MPMSSSDAQSDPTAVFERLRPRLFGLAYRMTGSIADSEDVLQEVFLSWSKQDRSAVVNPAAFLTRAVVNRTRDLMRSAVHRREQYVGPWLPEPLLSSVDSGAGAAADEQLELAQSLGMAFMLMLERLNANERAVFVLKEVFDYRFEEIAELVEASPAACRKAAERARKKVHADRPAPPVDHARTQAMMIAFMSASAEGDVGALTALLRDDAVLYSDGGGKIQAALKPIFGSDRIARFVFGVQRKQGGGVPRVSPAWINGGPGLLIHQRDDPEALDSCVTMDLDDEGKIAAIYVVRNPDKLEPLTAAIH